MPLTFLSHQAVVLPLKLGAPRWTSGTALVLGSMAPDAEYFMRTYPSGTISHTWPGQLTFCLPVTLVLYWVVTRIVAVPLAAHLPPGGSMRLHEYALLREQPETFRHWMTVAVSALIGSSSHVLLDRLSGGWSTFAAAQYGGWPPFSLMTADWHWIGFKLATWVVLALATLGMLRDIGRRALVRRWIQQRAGEAGSPSDAVGRHAETAANGARGRSHDGFWLTVGISGAAGGVLGAIFRRSGFFMHQPATWIHIGLAAMSAGFFGLIIASLMWQRRASHAVTIRGESQ